MAEMSNCVKDEFLPVTEGCTQWNFGQRPKQSGITRPADKMGEKHKHTKQSTFSADLWSSLFEVKV